MYDNISILLYFVKNKPTSLTYQCFNTSFKKKVFIVVVVSKSSSSSIVVIT